MMEQNRDQKLQEEKLANATGGGWWNSDKTYESGDYPRYSVGQVVLGDFYIKAINGKSGTFHPEFTYYVVSAFDHSKVYDEKMYESELVRMERNAR